MPPVVKVYNMLNYSSDIQLDYSLTRFICIHSKLYTYRAYTLLNPVNYCEDIYQFNYRGHEILSKHRNWVQPVLMMMILPCENINYFVFKNKVPVQDFI